MRPFICFISLVNGKLLIHGKIFLLLGSTWLIVQFSVMIMSNIYGLCLSFSE